MPIIDIRGLSVRFPDGTQALSGINLSIDKHEILVIAGRNGSGKTVLMRCITGLIRPSEGTVLFEGKPICENLREVRRRIGLVFQNSENQIVGQTAREDVAFGPENLKFPRERINAIVEQSLEQAGLSEKAEMNPYHLSGGEKKKLAVAGILAMEPDVVIFDEPFAGLDYPGVRDVLSRILMLYENGKAVVVITHELEKVLAHATRLVVMEKGRIAADGEPMSLLPCLEDLGIKRPHHSVPLNELTWL